MQTVMTKTVVQTVYQVLGLKMTVIISAYNKLEQPDVNGKLMVKLMEKELVVAGMHTHYVLSGQTHSRNSMFVGYLLVST